MSQHTRKREWEIAVPGETVGVANTGGDQFDQYFTLAWLIHIDVLNGKGSVDLLDDRSGDSHVVP
jgi:hypothetical protein